MNPENLKIYSNWVDQKHPSDIKELIRQRNNQINSFLDSNFLDYYDSGIPEWDLRKINIINGYDISVPIWISEDHKQDFKEVQKVMREFVGDINSLGCIREIELGRCQEMYQKYITPDQNYISRYRVVSRNHSEVKSMSEAIDSILLDIKEHKMVGISNYAGKFQYPQNIIFTYSESKILDMIKHIDAYKQNMDMEIKEESVDVLVDNFVTELSDLKKRCISYLDCSQIVINNNNIRADIDMHFTPSLLDLIFKKEQIIKYEAEVKLDQIIASNKSRLFKFANPGISNNEPLTQDNIKKTLLYKYSLDSEFVEFKHVNNAEIPLEKLPTHFRCRSIDLMIDLVYFGVGSVLAILYAITQIIGCDKFKDYFLYAGVVVLGFGIIGKICDYVNKCNSYRPSLCCSGCCYNVHLLCSCVTNTNTYHNSDLFTNSDDVKDYNDSCMGKCINNIV